MTIQEEMDAELKKWHPEYKSELNAEEKISKTSIYDFMTGTLILFPIGIVIVCFQAFYPHLPFPLYILGISATIVSMPFASIYSAIYQAYAWTESISYW